MKTKSNGLLVCLIVLTAAVFLSACEDDSANNFPDVTDISIPVANEIADTSLNISASKDESSPVAESVEVDEESSAEITEVKKSSEKDDDTAKPVDNSNTQATMPDATTVKPIPTAQPTEAPANAQAITSSGSSYEQIYNEYSQKLADYFGTAKGELQSEASSGKSIDALATSCSNKVSRLAEISTEGVNKMADLCVKRSGSTSDYMNYATKLESVYMDYGTKLESVYMSGAVNNQTKSVQQSLDDLGISSDISGQYSEEMNKAMDQYNKEMDKALDEYNQQVQDMLKQYGF